MPAKFVTNNLMAQFRAQSEYLFHMILDPGFGLVNVSVTLKIPQKIVFCL